MRTDTTFKRAFNDMIDIIRTLDLGEELPSENALRAQLGVSRTTVRKVLAGMSARGIIISEAHRRIIGEQPQQIERYPKEETLAISEQVETSFMEWMLRGDACPGTEINEAELARKFGVATTIVREFLNRFQKYGLIEKRQNAGWVLKGSPPISHSNCSRSEKCSKCAPHGCSLPCPTGRRSGSRSNLCGRHIWNCSRISTLGFRISPSWTAASTGLLRQSRQTALSKASKT